MPAERADEASGRLIQRKTCQSVAPSTRAASRGRGRRRPVPTEPHARRTGRRRKTWAITTASVVNGMERPATSSGSPSRPRRPKTSSRARPATEGGSTMGRSTTVSSTAAARLRRRARNVASGMPRATLTTTATAVVIRLRRSASRTAPLPATSGSALARALITRTATGRPRKIARSAAGIASATVAGDAFLKAT